MDFILNKLYVLIIARATGEFYFSAVKCLAFNYNIFGGDGIAAMPIIKLHGFKLEPQSFLTDCV